jgi:hypothetical protein
VSPSLPLKGARAQHTRRLATGLLRRPTFFLLPFQSAAPNARPPRDPPPRPPRRRRPVPVLRGWRWRERRPWWRHWWHVVGGDRAVDGSSLGRGRPGRRSSSCLDHDGRPAGRGTKTTPAARRRQRQKATHRRGRPPPLHPGRRRRPRVPRDRRVGDAWRRRVRRVVLFGCSPGRRGPPHAGRGRVGRPVLGDVRPARHARRGGHPGGVPHRQPGPGGCVFRAGRCGDRPVRD